MVEIVFYLKSPQAAIGAIRISKKSVWVIGDMNWFDFTGAVYSHKTKEYVSIVTSPEEWLLLTAEAYQQSGSFDIQTNTNPALTFENLFGNVYNEINPNLGGGTFKTNRSKHLRTKYLAGSVVLILFLGITPAKRYFYNQVQNNQTQPAPTQRNQIYEEQVEQNVKQDLSNVFASADSIRIQSNGFYGSEEDLIAALSESYPDEEFIGFSTINPFFQQNMQEFPLQDMMLVSVEESTDNILLAKFDSQGTIIAFESSNQGRKFSFGYPPSRLLVPESQRESFDK